MKMTKITLGELRRMIAEAFVHEADATEPAPEEEDSLDSQVDRYLADFENEAKSSKNEGFDFRQMTRRLVNEADAEDKAEDVAEPGKLAADAIDMESFVNGVVRLIENYDSLLEIKNALMRRAKNFLAKSYQPDVVDAFVDVLRQAHGLEIGKSKEDVAAEEFPAPAADRAGEGGASGAAV